MYNFAGKKKISATKVVVAIVVPLAVLGMIFAITIYLFKKKSKRYPSQDVRNGNHLLHKSTFDTDFVIVIHKLYVRLVAAKK